MGIAAMPSSPPLPRCYALIPCAGAGSRAGEGGPKQYRAVAGRPVVAHTLAAFAQVPRITGVLVAVLPGDTTLQDAPGCWVVPCGGATRADTVAGGLEALRARGAGDHDWVLVHDAARCLVTPQLIDTLIDACLPDAVGGLLAQPLADTLKQEQGGRVAGTVARAGKWLAQTPQMFRLGLLQQALAQAGETVTDEASAVEALGLSPLLVAGSASNFKLTWPDDFALAQAVLRSRQA
jgi:2-C-methyl-D-erythritol 4-phosphate cytidylyltransferase